METRKEKEGVNTDKDEDKSKARRAGTNVSIRRGRAVKGLVNYVRRAVQSQDGISPDETGCVTGRTVNSTEKQGGQYRRNKQCMWIIKATLFYLILRMQAAVLILISTCIWGMMKSNPVMMNKVQRPSKYTAQLFDCGVPRKMQLLQIPETCDEGPKEEEMAVLRETYILSPRKLKKTSV